MMWCNVHKSVHFTASNFILSGHSGMEEQNINDKLHKQLHQMARASKSFHMSSWVNLTLEFVDNDEHDPKAVSSSSTQDRATTF